MLSETGQCIFKEESSDTVWGSLLQTTLKLKNPFQDGKFISQLQCFELPGFWTQNYFDLYSSIGKFFAITKIAEKIRDDI